MKVETALKEIDEAVDKHIGGTDESFREAVEKALAEVESLVGGEGVDDLTRSVDSHIRKHESRPAPKEVREDAAGIVTRHGQTVPQDSYIAEKPA